MSGKTKNYTNDFKKQIMALRGNGKTALELSKKYGVAKSTLFVALDFTNHHVNWYNNKRLHSILGYVAPCEYTF